MRTDGHGCSEYQPVVMERGLLGLNAGKYKTEVEKENGGRASFISNCFGRERGSQGFNICGTLLLPSHSFSPSSKLTHPTKAAKDSNGDLVTIRKVNKNTGILLVFFP